VTARDLTAAAVVVAGFQGDTATARAAAGSEDARVRVCALGARHRLGDLDAAALAAAVADPSPAVRRRAAGLAPPTASPLLVGLLDDPDPLVAEAAAWALGEAGDDAIAAGAVGRLAALAGEHRDPLVREAAVAALGALGDPGGRAAVLAACADKPAVRRRAVLALAAFEGPEVEAALEAALGDRDWQVRQVAEDLTDSAPRS
jgi:HEAT repeat protein